MNVSYYNIIFDNRRYEIALTEFTLREEVGNLFL
jgi:hypothetical protein